MATKKGTKSGGSKKGATYGVLRCIGTGSLKRKGGKK